MCLSNHSIENAVERREDLALGGGNSTNLPGYADGDLCRVLDACTSPERTAKGHYVVGGGAKRRNLVETTAAAECRVRAKQAHGVAPCRLRGSGR
jgi:hypothetical protein